MNSFSPSQPILKHKGRPKSKLLKASKWWIIKYLGTVEAVKDWRAPGSRLELMAFVRSAQAATKASASAKTHTAKRLWISLEWLHVTDQFKKKLYALSRTEEIGSFCHASDDDGNHYLLIKVVNPKTSNNDCIILATHDIVTIRHICQVLKVAVESSLEKTRAKVKHLMSLKQGHSRHEYEEIELYGDTSNTLTNTSSSLPHSTLQFLEDEAKNKKYDIPRQNSSSSSKSSFDDNWMSDACSSPIPGFDYDIADIDDDSQDGDGLAHYDHPLSLNRRSYDTLTRSSPQPHFHYKVPRLLSIDQTSHEHVTYESPEPEVIHSQPEVRHSQPDVIHSHLDADNEPDAAIYDNDRVLTIIRRECLSREPIEEKLQHDSGHEEVHDSPVVYEPLRVAHPIHKFEQMSSSQEDDSGLEDNDSVEIQIKADIHSEPTEFSKMVQHFAAGDDEDLYAIIEKSGQKTVDTPRNKTYEEERQEFMQEVEQMVPPLQFMEFQDIVYLYDHGEADLNAMVKRARVLFREERKHLRREMVKVIRLEQRQAFLDELERQLNYTGSDNLLSSLKKRKHSNPRRRVRFGTVRSDTDLIFGRTTSMESLTSDISPIIDNWSSKVMEELTMKLKRNLRTDTTRQNSSTRPMSS